jgi:hypothetical protein
MTSRGRYEVVGWVTPTEKNKECHGVEYLFGRYDSLDTAEAVKYERLRCGWGRVMIRDLTNDKQKNAHHSRKE